MAVCKASFIFHSSFLTWCVISTTCNLLLKVNRTSFQNTFISKLKDIYFYNNYFTTSADEVDAETSSSHILIVRGRIVLLR